MSKTAKEMFKELEFRKVDDTSGIYYRSIDDEDINIWISLDGEKIEISFLIDRPSILSKDKYLKLHNAITKQIEELESNNGN